VRTNPKSGSMEPRIPRGRTVSPKNQEPVAPPTVSKPDTPVEGVQIQDDIARLAYSLWEARGGNGGSAEEDWYRAEKEILARSKT